MRYTRHARCTTWSNLASITGRWATSTRARYSTIDLLPWCIRAILKVGHPNETGARGAYLVDVDADGNVRLDFRATDTVRWERVGIDIGVLETEQDLLDKLHDEMQALLDGAEGRSVVTRITLAGRGEVNRLLRQPNAVEDLLEGINDQWARRLPFAWCERIEDATASPLDRDSRRAGADFLAEVLRTVGPDEG